MSSSAFPTSVDPALVINANYQFDTTDRRYLDDQAIAAQNLLKSCVLSGQSSAYFTSGAAVNGGDVVCLDATGRMVTANTANLAVAGGATLGVAMVGVSAANLPVLVAMYGVVPAAVTGLNPALSGTVYVSATGRCTFTSGSGVTSLGVAVSGALGLTASSVSATSRITPWDANHTYAWSLNQATQPATILNEGSGGTATLTPAFTSNGNTLPQPMTFGARGPFGNCVRFWKPVASSPSQIAGAGSATLSTSSFTAECFVYFETYTGYAPPPFGKWGSYLFQASSSSLVNAYIWIGTTKTQIVSSVAQQFSLGTWQHWMLTYDGTTATFYISGEIVGTIPLTGAMGLTANPIEIGQSSLSGSNCMLTGNVARCAISSGYVRSQAYARTVTATANAWPTS